jgi:hypothetical protein
MKSTLASAPNASASITSRSISEVANTPHEIQYNLSYCSPGSTYLLKRDAISVARSFVSGNRCPVDKTMEETLMKHSKSHRGAGGGSAGVCFA